MRVITPRLSLLVNREQIPGLIEAHISSGPSGTATSFRISCHIEPNSLFRSSVWSSLNEIEIELWLSTGPDNRSIQLVVGNADTVQIDPIGKTVIVSGRDFASLLIDSRWTGSDVNQTASEIVGAIATRHGLPISVTPTDHIMGRPDQDGHDYVRLLEHCRSLSDWDVVIEAARHEAYDAYFSGRTLNFHPTGTDRNAFISLNAADLIRLRLEHNLHLGRLRQFTVQSWDPWYRAVAAGTAQDASSSTLAMRGPVTMTRPSLDSSSASNLAERQLTLARNAEFIIDAITPIDRLVSPRSYIFLHGTGTVFDRLYRIDSINWDFNSRFGCKQHLRAHSQSNQA